MYLIVAGAINFCLRTILYNHYQNTQYYDKQMESEIEPQSFTSFILDGAVLIISQI
jgi:hypothetical protein